MAWRWNVDCSLILGSSIERMNLFELSQAMSVFSAAASQPCEQYFILGRICAFKSVAKNKWALNTVSFQIKLLELSPSTSWNEFNVHKSRKEVNVLFVR